MEKGTVMHEQPGKRPQRRPGFTLIELLVVMSIITFLAGLAVLIGPALLKSEQASRGAQLLQGNLFIAKQQALRNAAPYGIRLLPDRDVPTNVRSFQFIQQPDNFSGGTVTISGPRTLTFGGVDLSGGLSDPTLWPVQAGDFIQVSSGTAYHKITGVSSQAGTGTVNVQQPGYAPALVNTTTSDYRIVRAPRPVAGEETIFLPEDVIIDLSQGRSQIAADTTTGNYDILFAPAGAILGSAANSGKIILWVSDTTQTAQNVNTSEQSLIVVYARTGLIAAFPVDTTSGDPYSYTKDPRAAGGF